MKQNYNLSTYVDDSSIVWNFFSQKSKATLVFTLLFTFLGLNNAFGQSPFTDNNTAAPNTFTVPAGVTSITIQLWGGGGAGGGGTINSFGGSGGGSGGYSTRTYAGLVGGEIINYTLGTGGTGSTGNGTAGGNSTLTFGGFTLTANGGNGGLANSGLIGTGGTATGGTTNTTGNNGTLGGGSGGNGGNAPTAQGGTGGTGSTNNPGNPGNAPGGGGGGGERGGGNQAGGNGGSGGIRITFTCPTFTAGTDQNLATCATTTTLAAAALPSGTTGAWTVTAGTATVTTPSSPTSGVTGIIPGTPVTLRWTVTNGNCGSSFDDVIITSPIGPACLNFCTPTGNLDCTVNDFISNVTFNTLNNTSTCAAGGYINYAASGAQTTSVLKGSTYNLSLSVGAGTGTHGAGVWIDFNQNGVFTDAGEFFLVSNAITPNTTTVIPITIPAGAATGALRMRIRYAYLVTVTSTMSCTMAGTFGETEDYTITSVAPAPCVAPTAQPTALSLTPAGSTIAGGFIAASPVADRYLVVVSTSATPPSAPINGTTYTIGGTLAPGYTIVDNDGNTTFSATGLTPLTTYYFYVYSFNSLCTGGPLYLGASPLTGNTTTTSGDYCTPTIGAAYATSTNHHIRKVEFIGTLQDITNTSTFTSVAPIGYENYTGLAVKSIQAKGEGVNIYMESPNSGYIKAWVDWNNDRDFLDAGETVYDAGGVSQASTTLGFIVPTSISAGDYRVRLRISGRNGAGADAGFAWDACTTNLAYFGETEDYILRVIENCPVKITSLSSGDVCGSGSVTLNVTGTAGTTQYRWYAAQTGGAPLATTATGTWNTPVISTSTTYWVTAFNGTCETLVRAKIVAIVKTVPTLTFSGSTTEVCGENSIVALTSAGDFEIIHLLNENFETGLGTFSNVHNVSNPAVNATTAWQIRTGPYVPTGLTWYPAIQSNFGANNFAFVNSDIGGYSCPPAMSTCYYVVDNGLVSNTVNSTGFIDLTFKFRLYFDRYYPNGMFPTDELMTIDVSTNGGTTWTALSGDITADVGYGSRFTDYSYNLSAYINQTNLKVRIRYYSSTWANGGAVDDIELFGSKALNTAFQWTGTSLPDAYLDGAATIPYTTGTPASIVYVKPTLAQLETGSYTFTATATLSNGCNVSQNITILNKSKIWKGGIDNNWNNTSNWSPAGVPDANTCVIIPDIATTSNRPSEINTSGTSAFGKTLIVKANGVLRLYANNNLTIGETITVAPTGLIDMENSSNLVQISNVTNTGNINMKRNATVRRQDYVYWSSPVASFASNAVSPGTNLGYQYKWLPTTGAINNFGNWAFANETMVLGKGYCLRAPDSYSLSAAANYTASFIGVPNNGNITTPISRGSYDGPNYSTGVSTTLGTKDDDNWNLVGNPYPSAIDAIKFLTLNTNIAGFVNIWTHGTLPSTAIADPFYNNYAYNYTATDYITYNATGTSTPLGFNGFIGAGQGFFVSMLHTSAATTENLIFNNDLRRDIPTGNTYSNSQFFKTSNTEENSNTYGTALESHRIWFDLVSPSGTSARSLLGYVKNATNENDRLFDAFSNEKLSFNIFSLIDEERMLIQGRKLPFDANDKVNIGVSIPQDGLYKIAIGYVDGLFLNSGQNIYLEDKLLNVIFNLKEAPYSFMANKGSITDRFIIRFAKDTKQNIVELQNQFNVYDNNVLTAESGKLKIKNIQIFDILGKELLSKNNVNNTTYEVTTLNRTNSLMIVKVTLEDNTEEVRKVIY